MADSQGRTVGDTGYDPTTETDPSQSAGTGTAYDPNTASAGYDWFATNAPTFTVKDPTSPTLATNIGNTSGIEGATINLKNPNTDDWSLFSSLLAMFPNDPQKAIDELNQLRPNNGVKAQYYPNLGKGVIGVQGQSLPYLVAPGTVGTDQTAWQLGGVPGGDSGGNPVGDYTNPAVPSYLQSPYAPTPFTEQFTAPTLSDLQATPGYQAGLNTYLQGVQRAQAARGNILSGGAVKALGRDAADYANQQYQNIYNNAFDAYKAKYGIAQDANNNALAARQLNDNEFNQSVTNSLNQYLTRYGAYQDLIKNNLSYADLGLRGTQAGNPGGSGASVG